MLPGMVPVSWLSYTASWLSDAQQYALSNNPMAVILRDIDSPTIMECAHGPQQQQLQGQQQRNAHSYDSFVSVEMPWGIVELN
jgi:hypothetical protein